AVRLRLPRPPAATPRPARAPGGNVPVRGGCSARAALPAGPGRPQGLRRSLISAVMANVGGEGAGRRSTRTVRAEGALRTSTGDQESPGRLRRVLAQARVFAGAAFAAVYTRTADRELLQLVESVGAPGSLYGVRDSYPAAGPSPAA